MIKGMPKYSNWGPYKRWCQQTGRKVWCFSHLEDFCFDAAADQLAAYLGDIRNSTTTTVGCHGALCNLCSTAAGIGIPAGQVSQVCKVRTVSAYLKCCKD